MIVSFKRNLSLITYSVPLYFCWFLEHGLRPTGTQYRIYRSKQSGTDSLRRPPNRRLVECCILRGMSTKFTLELRGCTLEMAAPMLRAEGKDMLSKIGGTSVSEERLIFRNQCTQSISSARLASTVYKQITSILVSVEEEVVRRSRNARRAAESSPDNVVLSVMRTVVNELVAKDFQSSAFYSGLENFVQNCMVEPRVVSVAATKIFDASAFTVLVARSIKNVFERYFLKKTKMDSCYNQSNIAVDNYKKKAVEKSSTVKIDLNRLPLPTKETFDGEKTNPNMYSSSMSSDESEDCHYKDSQRDMRRRSLCSCCHYIFTSTKVLKQTDFVFGLKILATVNERYRMAVNCWSDWLIRKSQRYEDDVFFQRQRTRKKATFQIKDYALLGGIRSVQLAV